jgi:hypothetical protein
MSKTKEVVAQTDELTESVAEFKQALAMGVAGIVKAAQIYVKTIDKHPEAANRFREAVPGNSSTMWGMLERVGRKQTHPMLLMGDAVEGAKARFVRRLPYSDQERVFDGARYPLLLDGGDTLLVSIQDATPAQVDQLCGYGSIRTASEQRAWMLDRAARMKAQAEAEKVAEAEGEIPYRVENGKVVFTKGVTLTRTQLKNILAEM